MSKRIKALLSLLICIAIVVFTMVALGRDIFHAFEEIVYDHQATIWSDSGFSKLTNKVVLFCAVLSIFLIPFYTTKLIQEDFEIPTWVFRVKYVVCILNIFIFILVLLVFFPVVWISSGIEESIKVNFLGDCLFSHLLIPFLFVISYVFLDEKPTQSKKEIIATYIVLGIYILIYVLFVYIVQTWEDFYFLSEIVSKITIFGFIGVSIVVSLVPLGIHYLLKKVK